MPMLRLTRHQRVMVAEKLLDTANIAIGGLVFGQFVADRTFSPWLAATGLAIWLVGVVVALGFTQEE